jgi:hypothetical protein
MTDRFTPPELYGFEGEVFSDVEQALFDFLNRKYVQRSDVRQKAMGLQYMEAETHDLAAEIARFLATLPISIQTP